LPAPPPTQIPGYAYDRNGICPVMSVAVPVS